MLLVDDEWADAQRFIELIRKTYPAIQIHHVLNGQAALNYLEQSGPGQPNVRPHLIVLDLDMPVMNGHQFLERVKAHPSLGMIPVLVVTDSEVAHDVERSYQLHASGYIVKPSNHEGFPELVKAIGDYWYGVVKLPPVLP